MSLIRSEAWLTSQGYLSGELEEKLFTTRKTFCVYEGDAILAKPRIVATQVSFASDGSFQSVEDAVRHVTGPTLLNGANIFWNQALLDVLLEYPIHSDRSQF